MTKTTVNLTATDPQNPYRVKPVLVQTSERSSNQVRIVIGALDLEFNREELMTALTDTIPNAA